jgi:hypothetical protein
LLVVQQPVMNHIGEEWRAGRKPRSARSSWRSAAKLLSKDEARRIALMIHFVF